MEQSVFWSTTFPISSVIIFLSRARSGHSRRKCSVSCGPWPQSHCVVTSCSALRLSDWLRWWALSRVCPTISLFNRTSAARSTQPVVFWRVLCRLSLTQGIRLWVNLPSVWVFHCRCHTSVSSFSRILCASLIVTGTAWSSVTDLSHRRSISCVTLLMRGQPHEGPPQGEPFHEWSHHQNASTIPFHPWVQKKFVWDLRIFASHF